MWWRRGSKPQRSEAPAAVVLGSDGKRVVPVVTLRSMTDAEYVSMRTAIEDDYAREIGRVTDKSIEEARTAAAKQFADLLPHGVASEGHYLWKIIAEQDGAVGDVWTFIDPGKRRAFIYFIGTDERYRGKGYGKAGMLALESVARSKGADHIDLNVFGENTTAIRLYEALGYRPTAINMRKVL